MSNKNGIADDKCLIFNVHEVTEMKSLYINFYINV